MKVIYDRELRTWAGSAKDFEPGIQFALAAQGLKQKELLIQAGFKSLKSWVDCQISDIESGLRSAPDAAGVDVSHLEEARKAKAADRKLGFA